MLRVLNLSDPEKLNIEIIVINNNVIAQHNNRNVGDNFVEKSTIWWKNSMKSKTSGIYIIALQDTN